MGAAKKLAARAEQQSEDNEVHAGQEAATVSTQGRFRMVVRVSGYLLCSRECMVETGHISHNGFLIRTSSVDNVYKVAGFRGGRDQGYDGKHKKKTFVT